MNSATGWGSDPAVFITLGALLIAFSGVPALWMKRSADSGQKTAAAIIAIGAVSGLAGALASMLSGSTSARVIDWGLPFGACETAVDPLSALFLLPVFFVPACCAVYAIRYWPAAEHHETARKLTFFFGPTVAAMVLLIMARNMVLFLIAWEMMALSAYFLLAAESDKQEVRESGFLYLAATHTGTLALFAMFATIRGISSSFLFPATASLSGSAPLAAIVLVTALVGFGMKAGLFPLHVWLPTAHANAPSHVSAVMSGVVIKMGVYGIIRVLSFFTAPPLWWGTTLLAAGIVTALFGIITAVGQKEIKRLLAYSSIENIGIITMGIGVAVIGQSMASPPLILLGMGGALLHVVNHSLFKPLLFLNAGTLIHATGKRDIDTMGGLAHTMPRSALLFLAGAVAICGLPPLNGFAGEYLVYLGFFTGVQGAGGAAAPLLALGAAALALVGGLAAACFLKVYGVAFLGVPRADAGSHPHDPDRTMLAPMGLLALLCLAIGLLPAPALRLLHHPVRAWSPLAADTTSLASLAPVGWLTVTSLALGAVLLPLAILYLARVRRSALPTEQTWGCGYAMPTARMEYTGSSFTETLVHLFRGVLRPRSSAPSLRGHFPGPGAYASSLPDPALDLGILPFSRLADRGFTWLRKLQHGEHHLYILYIFITLVALLVWAR
jgi:hydrogenase-4 component B